VAYESGAVILWNCNDPPTEAPLHSRTWTALWKTKVHSDAVMAMAFSPSPAFAMTVSSEHLIVKYPLEGREVDSKIDTVTFRTKWPGNSSIHIRTDGKVCAVGGWDGKIRLYSTKTCKPLGTLNYHKTSCQSVIFAHQYESVTKDSDISAEKDLENVQTWLAGGGKDGRISIWRLMDFSKS